MAGPGLSHQTSSLRQIVTSLYPDALTRTYCVPPVHFNRIHIDYVSSTVPGTDQSVLVLPSSTDATPRHNDPQVSQRLVPPSRYSLWTPESQPHLAPLRVQESDSRYDFAQNHVMFNLQKLGDSCHEAMFILSQLSFGNYLNQPAFAAAAAQLPRPSQLDTKKIKYSDGETDFVLIHRRHGILVGELKSVGKSQACGKNPQPPADVNVAKRVIKAVKQLDRSQIVVRHLVSDVAPGLTVRKTIFLPYVSTAQLERVLDNDPRLTQAVCQSLGASNASEAVHLCCCSDQLSQPASYWHVTPGVLSQLSTWWQHRMACTVDTLLTDDKYLDIVARFVGSATMVSAGQALAELGERLPQLVLTIQQLDLMQRNMPRVCITGPPGTGKTVTLVLQGLRWLVQGCDIHIVSTDKKNRAVNLFIKHQLEIALRLEPTLFELPGCLHYHEFDFTISDEVEKAVDSLSSAGRMSLNVLLDEAEFDRNRAGLQHRRLVTELAGRVPHLYLWAACVGLEGIPPVLHIEVLSTPLRFVRSILRELQPELDRLVDIPDYSESGIPSPEDGLKVIRLAHHGKAHHVEWPIDCIQCGQEIAMELFHLGVRSESFTDGRGGRTPGRPEGQADDVGQILTPQAPLLNYRDVFILTGSGELHDDATDGACRVSSAASGVVCGLRNSDLPVCVQGEPHTEHDRARWDDNLHDMAVAAKDQITVSLWKYTSGLERKVVVWLQGKEESASLSDESSESMDRLCAISRCTTYLITVKVAGDKSGKDASAEKRHKDNSDPAGVTWVKKKGFLL